MAKTKKALKTSNKAFRHNIAKRLEKTLEDLHEALGEKKFRRRIKKASKLLAGNLSVKQKETVAEPGTEENGNQAE